MSDLPLDLQRQLFAAKTIALGNIAKGRQVDPATVQRLLHISTMWPSIKPGAAFPLAASGLDGNSAQVRNLARLSFKQTQLQSQWQDHFDNTVAKQASQWGGDANPDTETPKPSKKDPAPVTQHHIDRFVTKLKGVGSLDDFKAVQSDPLFKKLPKDTREAVFQQAAKGQLSGGIVDDVVSSLGYSLARATRGDIEGAIAGPSAETRAPGDTPVKIAGTGAQDVIREGFAAANTGLQTLQGMVRNEAGGGTPLFSASGQDVASQTDLGQQITHGLDIGDGYLPSPDSPAAQAAHQVQLQAAPTIGGHAFTLGRGTASLIFDPNTQPFNVLSGVVDGAVALKGDPTYHALNMLGDTREAARTLAPTMDDTGRIVTTTGNMVDPTRVTNYYAGEEFNGAAQHALDVARPAGAPQGNTARMWRLLNSGVEPTSSRFPIIGTDGTPLIERLTDSADVNEFRDVMSSASDVKSVVPAPGVGYHVRRATSDIRAFHDMPPSSITNPFDKNVNVKVMDDVMAAANVPETTRDIVLDHAIRNPDPLGGFDAMHEALVESVLSHNPSMTRDEAAAIAAPFTKSPLISRAYDIDQATGAERIADGTVIAGQGHAIPHPVLEGQALNTIIPLPNARELRQLTSNAAWLTGSVPWKVTTTALAAPTYLFRMAAVASGRIALRSIAEAQLNAASRGFMTTLAHPLTAIGAAIADNPEGRLAGLVEDLGVKPAYATDFMGSQLSLGADDLMMHSAGLVQTPDTIATKGWVAVPITHPDAGFGLTDYLNKLHSDPVMRGIAEAGSPEAAKDWFWGEGGELPFVHYTPTPNVDSILKEGIRQGEGVLGDGVYLTRPGVPGEGWRETLFSEPGIREGGVAPVPAAVAGNIVALDDVPFADLERYGLGRKAGLTRVVDKAKMQEAAQADGYVGASFGLGTRHEQVVVFDEANVSTRSVPTDAKALREARQPRLTTQDNWGMRQAASDPQKSYTPIGDIVNDRTRADNYIENVLYPILMDTTGNGDEELMQAVRDGKLNGVHMLNVQGGGDLKSLDARARAYAKSLLEQGRGPQNSVLLREEIANPKSAGEIARSTAIYKHAVDTMFHWIVDVPEKYLNRNFTWRQLYYNEGVENLKWADQKTYDAFLANAEKANVSDELLNKIRRVKLVNDPNHTIDSLERLDYLSRANAADQAAKIFHDLGARSQFFDQARFAVPFGDAFRLIAQRMVHLVADEPQVVRRLQQGVQEAKQPGSGTINRMFGDPLPDDEGFFHTDPATNEQTWMVPGSNFIDSSLLGIPVPLQGQVKGLNMLADGYPGLGGPALGLPAKWLLADSPTETSIKSTLFPYGGSSSSGVAEDLGSVVLPSWLQKVTEGAVDAKAYNSTFNDVINTLQTTQKYKLFSGDPASRKAELIRLVNDAKDKTRELYLIRGGAQFFLPSLTTPAYQTADPKGHLTATSILTKHYAAIAYDGKKYQGQTGQKAAMAWLINTKGVDSLFVAQPASVPNTYSVPQTDEAVTWVKEHPGVKDSNPLTYGFFAPVGGKRSFDAYNASVEDGARTTLDPATQAAQAENRLGYYAYDNMRERIITDNKGRNLTQKQSEWLSDYAKELQATFPGFRSFQANPFDTKTKLASAVSELESSASDPTLSSTPAGQGIAAYIAVRNAAIEQSRKDGLRSPFQAKKAAPIRAWMVDAADKIAAKIPEFRPVWEQVFAREFPISAPTTRSKARPSTTTAPADNATSDSWGGTGG